MPRAASCAVALAIVLIACNVAANDVPEDAFSGMEDVLAMTSDGENPSSVKSFDTILAEVSAQAEGKGSIAKQAAKAKSNRKAKKPSSVLRSVIHLKAYCMAAYAKAKATESGADGEDFVAFGKIAKFVSFYGDPKFDKDNPVLGYAFAMAKFRRTYAYLGVNAYLATAINDAVLGGKKMLKHDNDGEGADNCPKGAGFHCYADQYVLSAEALGFTNEPQYFYRLSAPTKTVQAKLLQVRAVLKSPSSNMASLAWLQEGAKGAYDSFIDQVRSSWANKKRHLHALVVQDAQSAARKAYLKAKENGEDLFARAVAQSPAAMKAATEASARFQAVEAEMPSMAELKKLAKKREAAYFKHRQRWSVAEMIKQAIAVEQGVQIRYATGVQLHSGSNQKPLVHAEGSLRTVHKTLKALPPPGEARTATITSLKPVGEIKRLIFKASGTNAWNFAYVGVRLGTRGTFVKFVPCNRMKTCKTALTVTWLSKNTKKEDAKASYELCPCGTPPKSKPKLTAVQVTDSPLQISEEDMDEVLKLSEEEEKRSFEDEDSMEEFSTDNDSLFPF